MDGGIGFKPIPRTSECHNIFNVKIAVSVFMVGRVGLEPTCFKCHGFTAHCNRRYATYRYWCAIRDSNPEHFGSKPNISASWINSA